jgi:hypothetical protein
MATAAQTTSTPGAAENKKSGSSTLKWPFGGGDKYQEKEVSRKSRLFRPQVFRCVLFGST